MEKERNLQFGYIYKAYLNCFKTRYLIVVHMCDVTRRLAAVGM